MTTTSGLRHVEHCMGTVFSLDVRAPGVDARVIDDVVAMLHDVDATFSTYQPDSPISRLARGEIALEDCGPDVRWVLDACDELERVTDGYFSAFIAGDLDPSGFVKGWAIERASDLLVSAGSTSHCVNGGGDVQCVGEPTPGEPWRIGIAHPLRPGTIATVITGRDIAVATSGTAERGAHVIDPRTARPATEFASITITGRHLVDADAYATAAFAMGAAARDWVQSLDGYDAFAVMPDGGVWDTRGPR